VTFILFQLFLSRRRLFARSGSIKTPLSH
jgi:hypothetical protein